jgi:hypothetical protein
MQDIDTDQNSNGEVWDDWQAVWRDVFVLDGANSKVNLYNLTVHDLRTPANYAELKSILIDSAMVSQKPFTNESIAVDVDGNGIVAPRDALLVINRLNSGGGGTIAPPTGTSISEYIDVDGNLIVAPLDALRVINVLNQRTGGGEGEAAAPASGPMLEESFGSEAATGELPVGAVRNALLEPVSAHEWFFAQWGSEDGSGIGEPLLGTRLRRPR